MHDCWWHNGCGNQANVQAVIIDNQDGKGIFANVFHFCLLVFILDASLAVFLRLIAINYSMSAYWEQYCLIFGISFRIAGGLFGN